MGREQMPVGVAIARNSETRASSACAERRRMNFKRGDTSLRIFVASICTLILIPGDTLAYVSSSPQASASSATTQSAKISAEQLDSLVAPIALYPDPLLAQTLAAATYPLEIIQLQQ